VAVVGGSQLLECPVLSELELGEGLAGLDVDLPQYFEVQQGLIIDRGSECVVAKVVEAAV